jgi:nicotinate phosphoribosyltransferase
MTSTPALGSGDVSQRWARRENLALLTDFYQLTMMGGYLKTGRQDLTACFNYFFRELPPHNGFAVTAGLEQLLDLIENLRFSPEDLSYLAGLDMFDPDFLEYLREFRVQCTIEAIPEGTVVFPHEPVLQVRGPLIQAQLLETAILNMLNFQTLIATKAARIRQACGNDNLVEFGLRGGGGGGPGGPRAPPPPPGRTKRHPRGVHRRGGQHLERLGRQGVRHPRTGNPRPLLGDELR